MELEQLRERPTVAELHDDPARLRAELENLFEGRAHDLVWLPHALGYRPWWPSVGDVWANRGVVPQPNHGTGYYDAESWSRAWAVLERLHAEYQASKQPEGARL